MVKEKDTKRLQGYVEHIAPTAKGVDTAMDGLWLWHSPTLAINYYNMGMSLERIVPTSHDTVEIRYQYAFLDPNDTIEHTKAIDTSREVTLEDVQICENVQLNLSGGGYVSPGLLSPRHEDGVGFFQDVIRETHGLPINK